MFFSRIRLYDISTSKELNVVRSLICSLKRIGSLFYSGHGTSPECTPVTGYQRATKQFVSTYLDKVISVVEIYHPVEMLTCWIGEKTLFLNNSRDTVNI